MPETRATTLVDVQLADATCEAYTGSIQTIFQPVPDAVQPLVLPPFQGGVWFHVLPTESLK